jgi:acetyl-CoA acetyltransferase
MAYGGTNEAWIVGAVRTPVGRHGGALSPVRPDDLGALALEKLMERTGVPPEEVEDVYMVGVGQGIAMAVESGSQP